MSLKRKSMYGLEIEAFTLDGEGRMVDGAPKVLSAVEGTRLGRFVRREISKSMVELGAKEKRSVRECALEFLGNLEGLTETASAEGYHLLPLGAHPGRSIPKLHTSEWYDAKKKVLGKDTFKEGRICGFHFHYTLPEGIVEKATQRIRSVRRSKAKDIFIQQYNFLVAADPAVLTFCQSTPFWMGFHWAKDCRVLVYRDLQVSKGARSMHGIHRYLPRFGSLPNYEFTLEDLRVMADMRKAGWLALLEQKRFPTNKIAGYPTLKFVWGPLRVNKVGTFEYRGPDMNHPSVIFSASRLLVYALKAIEEMKLKVAPSDLGTYEPFLLEDGTIYVPPHATLKHLEQQSVTNGFGSQSIHDYCSRLFALVSRLSRKGRRLGLLRKMLEERSTVSDGMLAMVRKNGYDPHEDVPEDMLNHLALYHADRLPAEIRAARELMERD
jgi:hypothetical protein